jgi:RNA polymerase sigma factor (sigma-70 family)
MQEPPKIIGSLEIPEENDPFDIKDFREGGEKAFRDVYERLGKFLLHFAQNLIDSLPDAEDIVSSAFSKLYNSKSRADFESLVHIRSWLFVIVRNECFDVLRYRARSREVSEDLKHMEKGYEEKFDIEKLKSDLLQSLRDAINRLPKQRKRVIELYFFEGKTTSEIAAILSIGNQTVLNHKTRALEALRKTVMIPGWLLY